MTIIFKNSDERKRHPQAGLIPDNIWCQYFIKNEIEGNLLDIMTAKPEELLKQIMNSNSNVVSNVAKEKILAAVVFGHQDLSPDTFDEIVHGIYGESNTLSDDIILILAAKRNNEYLKHVLTNTTNKHYLSVAFSSAAANGHIETLEYLEEIAPNDLQQMIQFNYCEAFCNAARYGHIEVLQHLEEKASTDSKNLIKTHYQRAFGLTAECGHISVLNYLAKKNPDNLQVMIKSNGYMAFFFAVKNGHTTVLKYLEEKMASKDFQDMIKARDYAAFFNAASNGHIGVLQYLEEKMTSKDFQDIIKAKNYEVFFNAASHGHIGVLQYLEKKVTSKEHLRYAIEHNYKVFRYAISNGHIGILQYLEKLEENLQHIIAADNYEVFKSAAALGHINVLNFLMRYDFVRDESFEIISTCSLDAVFTKSTSSDIKELLKHPAIFERACSYHPAEIEPFIIEQIKELKTRKLYGNPLQLLHNTQETECLFYLLHHLIERVGIAAKDDILFLLRIPELQAILATTRPPQNTPNLALRTAIIQKHSVRAGLTSWNEVIEALYAIPEVRTQAEKDGHYQTESSMQALTQEEEAQFEQLRRYYNPQIYGAAGHEEAWVHVINYFKNHYHDHKATFTNIKGEVITLPLEWNDFKKLNLSKKDYDLALQAYYQNTAHTAYRLFLRPNPWIAKHASFVELLDNGGRAANYEHLKDMITVLTFAAFDKNMPPVENSGFTLEGRITTFCESIALITRADNWNESRTSTDANGNHRRVQYNDSKGDKPFCFQGVQQRLIKDLLTHPLFSSIDVIAADAVRNELHNIIKNKLETSTECELISLHLYLQEMLISGHSAIKPITLQFDQTLHNALINNILGKYSWIKGEDLQIKIEKQLEEFKLFDTSNIFTTRELFKFIQKQIPVVAETQHITLPVAQPSTASLHGLFQQPSQTDSGNNNNATRKRR